MNTTGEESKEQVQAKLLLKWRGSRAKVWDYTPSLSRLTLRLEFRGIPGNLHIVAGACRHILGLFSWDNCALELFPSPQPDGAIGYCLRDSGAGFELLCGIVSMAENVEPVYFQDQR
jgi:hypothetical protein